MKVLKNYWQCANSNNYYAITNTNTGINLSPEDLFELLLLEKSLNNFTM